MAKGQVPQVPAPGGGHRDRDRNNNGRWREKRSATVFSGVRLNAAGGVASPLVVEVPSLDGAPERVEGPSRESPRELTKERAERCHTTSLDQSALLEVLEALKVVEVGDRVRAAVEMNVVNTWRGRSGLAWARCSCRNWVRSILLGAVPTA